MKPIYLDLPSVAEAVSLSPGTIQKLVRLKDFPAPRALSGNRVGWLVREVEEWGEKRPVSTIIPPPNGGRKKGSTTRPDPQDEQKAA